MTSQVAANDAGQLREKSNSPIAQSSIWKNYTLGKSGYPGISRYRFCRMGQPRITRDKVSRLAYPGISWDKIVRLA